MTAATSLRVERETKKEFDRVQGLVQSETGERLSQSELLARLLRVARKNEADLLAAGEMGWRPPGRRQLERLLGRAKGVRIKTDASQIDEVLYGGSPHE